MLGARVEQCACSGTMVAVAYDPSRSGSAPSRVISVGFGWGLVVAASLGTIRCSLSRSRGSRGLSLVAATFVSSRLVRLCVEARCRGGGATTPVIEVAAPRLGLSLKCYLVVMVIPLNHIQSIFLSKVTKCK
jgi:hypothetical protein